MQCDHRIARAVTGECETIRKLGKGIVGPGHGPSVSDATMTYDLSDRPPAVAAAQKCLTVERTYQLDLSIVVIGAALAWRLSRIVKANWIVRGDEGQVSLVVQHLETDLETQIAEPPQVVHHRWNGLLRVDADRNGVEFPSVALVLLGKNAEALHGLRF